MIRKGTKDKQLKFKYKILIQKFKKLQENESIDSFQLGNYQAKILSDAKVNLKIKIYFTILGI